MRLVPIESGWMSCDTEIMCEGGLAGEAEGIRFPVSCWLIEHERGNVLFDSGLHAELKTNPGRLGGLESIFDIEILGKRRQAKVLAKPAYDPQNKRLKA